MGYIGKSPNFGVRSRYIYTASAGATSISGSDDAGSTLSFSDGNYVDVFLNGVLLKPTTDYNTSTANTIAGLVALNLNDIVEIIVYDVFSVSDTVSAANGGTFSGGITLGGATPTLTIGDAGAEDTKIVFDGNAQDYHIGLDDTDDSIKIGLGSALGTTAHIISDSAGQVTMPLQPAFQVMPASNQNNIATDSWVDVVFGTERFDIGANFASNTFTAPVTGKYFLQTNLECKAIDSASTLMYVTITTSNKTYYFILEPDQHFNADTENNFNLSVLADMDASDTAKVTIYQAGGTAQMDVAGNSYFSGFLAT
tara:strand:+ start:242 stop:1174 length:933 start_codon:yes stop_codon:yes gene_type:complete